MKLSSYLIRLLVLLSMGACAHAADIMVFAAASLSDVFKELAPQYTAATGNQVKFNFAASGTLAKQIKEGAPADAFFSADEARVDALQKDGLILEGSRQNFLANTLVVVVEKDSKLSIKQAKDLTEGSVRRIAVGEPATVPVGTYTKKYLEGLALWEPVAAKHVPLESVRAVLAAVESGNADAGFVYKTDALISKKVSIAFEIPREVGPKVVYPGAVVKASAQAEAAKAFLAFLKTPAAQATFAKYGFTPLL